MIFGLAAGAFLGWAAAIYATPAGNRVSFWSPLSIAAGLVALASLVMWVLGNIYGHKDLPQTVIHNHNHFYPSGYRPYERPSARNASVAGGPPPFIPPDDPPNGDAVPDIHTLRLPPQLQGKFRLHGLEDDPGEERNDDDPR